MRANWSIALFAVAFAACSFDWDTYDPRGATSASGGSSSGSAGGGAGGTTSSSSTGASTASSGGGGTGGAGGNDPCAGGGPPGVLVDRGLLTRYYLDEAASGMQPMQLLDAAPNPLNLAISYAGANAFTQVACQRGMSWPAISLDGRAEVAVLGTKIENGLDGSKTGTIECVFDLTDADPSSSRISHIGTDSNPGRFTMFSDGPTSLGLDLEDQLSMVNGTVEEWAVDLANLGRIAAHLVLDTTQSSEAARVRLFVNGVDQGAGDLIDATIPLDSEIDIIAATDTYVVGNRTIAGRSIQGTIYYCAMYSAALTDNEVANNVAVLLADDDTP